MTDKKHHHNFVVDTQHGEKRTRLVLVLTAVTMIIEIVAGILSGSMALLADGWHMSTHVAAFGITMFAYTYAKRHIGNPKYSFGTGKVNVLGGFASAIALVVVAMMMAMESIERLFESNKIHFNEAIIVAVLGLVVNIVSAYLLGHSHSEHDHDHNLRAAYFHVIADALTSILAIIALFSGKYLGWNFLDPIMGIVGAIVISIWAWKLLKDTSIILLDGNKNKEFEEKIKETLSSENCKIIDFHLWKVSSHHYNLILSLVTNKENPPTFYKEKLKIFKELAHITIEINPES